MGERIGMAVLLAPAGAVVAYVLIAATPLSVLVFGLGATGGQVALVGATLGVITGLSMKD